MAKRLISLSGKIVRRSNDELDDDRYTYLSLEQAEPNPGNPASDNSLFFSNADGTRGFTKRPQLEGLAFDDGELNDAGDNDYALILNGNPTTSSDADSVGYRKLGDLAFTDESEITLQTVTVTGSTTDQGIVIQTLGSVEGSSPNSYGLKIEDANSMEIDGLAKFDGQVNLNSLVNVSGIQGIQSTLLLVKGAEDSVGFTNFDFTNFTAPTLQQVVEETISSGDQTSSFQKGAVTTYGLNAKFFQFNEQPKTRGNFVTHRNALVIDGIDDSIGVRSLRDLAFYDSTNSNIRVGQLDVLNPTVATLPASGLIPMVTWNETSKEYEVVDIEVENLDTTFETLHSVSGRTEDGFEAGETGNPVIFSNSIKLRGNGTGLTLANGVGNYVLVAELAASGDSAIVAKRLADDIAFNGDLVTLDYVVGKGDTTARKVSLNGDVLLSNKTNRNGNQDRVLVIQDNDSVGFVNLNTIAFTGTELDTLQTVTDQVDAGSASGFGDSTNRSLHVGGLTIDGIGVGLRIDSDVMGSSETVNRFLVYDKSSGEGQVILRELDNQVLDGDDTTLQTATERGRTTTLEIIAQGFVGDSATVQNLEATTQATLASASVTDLTTDRVVFSGAAGELEDDANLTFDGTSLQVGVNLNVDGLTTLDSTTINGRLVVDGDDVYLNGALFHGEISNAEANFGMGTSTPTFFSGRGLEIERTTPVSLRLDNTGDNTVLEITTESGAVNFRGISAKPMSFFTGNLERLRIDADGDLNVLNNLDVEGVTNLDSTSIVGTLDITGETTLDKTTIDGLLDANAGIDASSVKVEDLTSGRVVIAGTNGELEDDANFTFDGTALQVGVNLNVDGITTLDSTSIVGTLDVGGITTLDSTTIVGAVNLTGLIGTESLDVLTIDGSNEVARRTIESTAFTGETLTTVTDPTRPVGYDVTSTPLYLNGGISLAANATDTQATYKLLNLGSGASGDSVEFLEVDGSILDGSALGLNEVLTVGNTSNLDILLGGTSAITADSATFATNLSVGTQATLASAAVSDLTDNRVVIAGTSGELEDDANFTFDGTNLNLVANFDVSGISSLDSVTVRQELVVLGNLRVEGGTTTVNSTELSVDDINITIADGSTQKEDADGGGITLSLGSDGVATIQYDAVSDDWSFNKGVNIEQNFDVDGITTLDSTSIVGGFDVTGETTLDKTTIDGLLDANAGIEASSVKVEDLTSGRVVIAGTNGELEDDADLTFSNTTLTATNINVTTDLDVGGITTLDSTTIDATNAGLVVTGLTAQGTEFTVVTIAADGTVGTREASASAFSDPTLQNVTDQGYVTTRPIVALGFSGDSATLGTAKVSDLTATRIVLAGTDGELEDNGSLTYSNDRLNTNRANIGAGGLTVGTSNLSDAVSDNTVILGLTALDSVVDRTLGNILDIATLQYVTDHGASTTNKLTLTGGLKLSPAFNVNDQLTLLGLVGDSVVSTVVETTAHTALTYFTLDQAALTGSNTLNQQIDVTSALDLDGGFTASLTTDTPAVPTGAFDVIKLADVGGTDSAFRVTLQSGAVKPAEDYTWSFVLNNSPLSGINQPYFQNGLLIDRDNLPSTTNYSTSLIVPVFNTTGTLDSVGYRTLGTAANLAQTDITLDFVTGNQQVLIGSENYASTTNNIKIGKLIAGVPEFTGSVYAPVGDGNALFIGPQDSVGYRDVGAFAFRDQVTLQEVTNWGDSTTAEITMDALKLAGNTITILNNLPAISTDDALMYDSVSNQVGYRTLSDAAFLNPTLQIVTDEGDSTSSKIVTSGGLVLRGPGTPIISNPNATDPEQSNFLQMLVINTDTDSVKRGNISNITNVVVNKDLNDVTTYGSSISQDGIDSTSIAVNFKGDFYLGGLGDLNTIDTIIGIDTTTGQLYRRSVSSISGEVSLHDAVSVGDKTSSEAAFGGVRLRLGDVAFSDGLGFSGDYPEVLSVVGPAAGRQTKLTTDIAVISDSAYVSTLLRAQEIRTFDTLTIDKPPTLGGPALYIKDNGPTINFNHYNTNLEDSAIYQWGGNGSRFSLTHQQPGVSNAQYGIWYERNNERMGFANDWTGFPAFPNFTDKSRVLIDWSGPVGDSALKLQQGMGLQVDGITTLDSTAIDAGSFGNGLTIPNLGTQTTNTDVLTINGDVVSKTAFSDMYDVPSLQSVTDVGSTTTNDIEISDNYLSVVNTDGSYAFRANVGVDTFKVNNITPVISKTGIVGDDATNAALQIHRHGANALGPYLFLSKNRGTNLLNPAIVVSGDNLGTIAFGGNDGTVASIPGAEIKVIAEGTQSAGDIAATMNFYNYSSGVKTQTMSVALDSVRVDGQFSVFHDTVGADVQINKTSQIPIQIHNNKTAAWNASGWKSVIETKMFSTDTTIHRHFINTLDASGGAGDTVTYNSQLFDISGTIQSYSFQTESTFGFDIGGLKMSLDANKMQLQTGVQLQDAAGANLVIYDSAGDVLWGNV